MKKFIEELMTKLGMEYTGWTFENIWLIVGRFNTLQSELESTKLALESASKKIADSAITE